MSRKLLQEELNRINMLANEVDKNLVKSGASMEQRQQARDMAKSRRDKLIAEYGDDLQKMNLGKSITVKGGTISPSLSQSGLPDMASESLVGKEKMFRKQPVLKPEVIEKMPVEDFEKLRNFDKNVAPELADILEENKAARGAGQITKEADDAYKAAKGLKKMNVKGSSRFGLLLGALGAGAGLLSPDSKAAEVIGKVGEAAAELDPGTYLQKGMDSDVLEKEIARLKAQKEQKSLKDIVKPTVDELGGEPDMTPKRALSSVGELLSGESIDRGLEEKRLNAEEELRKRKNRIYGGGRDSGKDE